jgi:peptidyl-prolyl cis-trans isomerase C
MIKVLSGGCTRLVLAFAAAAMIVGTASAQTEKTAPADASTVIATVDGKPLTEGDLALVLTDIHPSGKALDPQRREQVIDFLIKFKLVSAAAAEAKLDQGPEFQAKLAFLRDKALMETYLDQKGKAGVTEDAVKKIYDETIKDIKPEDEVRARHVLLETEDEAKKAAERIKGGEDFAVVAKELSKDPGSGAEGGDLGFFLKEQMVPEFSEVAFKMKAGEVSAPVKSQYGWHIIKVEEKRQRAIPKLDEVRSQIEEYVYKKAQEDAVTKLVDAAKIERPEGQEKADETAPAKK